MKKIIFTKLIPSLFILLFLFILIGPRNKETLKFPWDSYTVEEAINLSDDRLIMIDFYADWWDLCNQLDTDTFSDKDVISYCTKKFINLKINTDTKYGSKIYKKYNITSLPTIIFLDGDGNKIKTIQGYHKPANYLKIIKTSF